MAAQTFFPLIISFLSISLPFVPLSHSLPLTESCCVVQPNLKLGNLLPQPPECCFQSSPQTYLHFFLTIPLSPDGSDLGVGHLCSSLIPSLSSSPSHSFLLSFVLLLFPLFLLQFFEMASLCSLIMSRAFSDPPS